MDPDLECFVRIPPKHLAAEGSHELDEAVTALALSSEPQLLAAGSIDDAIVVLRPDLSVAYTLEGHAGGTTALAFARGGRLVSTGEDGAAAVWQCGDEAGSRVARLECEGDHADKTPDGHTVSNAVCNPVGTLAACSAGRTLHLFEVDASDLEASRRVFPPVSGGVIEDVKFAGDGRLLAAYYGGVTVFSTEPGAAGLALEYGTNILSVAATPGLEYVVGGCMDSCVHIWRFGGAGEDGKPEVVEFSCGGYMSKVGAVEFDEGGTQLASLGGTQNTVWDFAGPDGPGGSVPVVALGHTRNCTCQAWQPLAGSSLLVTGGKDGRVLLYDTSQYAEPGEEGMPKFTAPIAVAPEPRPDEVTALAWGPADPQLIYVAHASGLIRSWRAPGGQQQPEES